MKNWFSFKRRPRGGAEPGVTEAHSAATLWREGHLDAEAIPDHVLYSRLQETIAWCGESSDRNAHASMRSNDLLPKLLHNGCDDAVCGVGVSRHLGVREKTDRLTRSFPDLLGGRLMVYFPDADLCDGAAEVESASFFDVFNTPPWDTWVSFFDDRPDGRRGYERYLLAYVPKSLVSLASAGIAVNPEECIAWLADADVKLRTRLVGFL